MKRMIILLIIFAVVLTSCSLETGDVLDFLLGDAIEDIADTISQELEKNPDAFKNNIATINVAYENIEDKSVFENRLAAIEAVIIEETAQDNVVTYTIKSFDKIDHTIAELFCDAYEYKIYTSESEEAIFTRADIISVSVAISSLRIKFPENFYEHFSEHYVRLVDVIFEINGEKYMFLRYPVEDSTISFVDAPNEPRSRLLKTAIALSSENPKGKIEITFVEQ